MARPRVVWVALALVCVVPLSLAGSFIAALAFGSTTERFALGTIRVGVRPTLDGRVDVYVPIVDWGVRASPFDAPIAVDVRFRSLDREAALRTLRSGPSAEEELSTIRAELAEIGRRALVRAAVFGVVGGVVGGIIGGALIGAALHRRSWLAYGAGVGFLAPLVLAAVSLVGLRGIDYEAFQRPTFYAHGAELPRLLSLSEQLAAAGVRYTQTYEQVLAGLSRLIASASSTLQPRDSARTALVGSDLHANALVLPVLAEFARDKTVFLVGDFTLLGTEIESTLAPRVRGLGARVVAVSGNHDSRPFMRQLARAGVVVLTRDGRLLPDGSVDGQRVQQIAGLEVAGYDDPLESPTPSIRTRALELTDEEYEREEDVFLSWFASLGERPDVVLVHQHRFAHALLDVLAGDADTPVAIFTGHDHLQHLDQSGPALLVDGGTVGAGGPYEIGVQAAGFAEVHFADENAIDTVDLIEIEPVSGEARAVREVIRLG